MEEILSCRRTKQKQPTRAPWHRHRSDQVPPAHAHTAVKLQAAVHAPLLLILIRLSHPQLRVRMQLEASATYNRHEGAGFLSDHSILTVYICAKYINIFWYTYGVYEYCCLYYGR